MIRASSPCVLMLAVSLCLPGCNTVGPASIAAGRPLYNEVINQTEDEQILGMIVRDRYDQTFGMLAVASVTANIKVGTSAEVQAGWGSSSNYEENLVPFTGGVAYEESPTISYVPLNGEDVMLRLLAPVTLEQAVTIGQLQGKRTTMLMRRLNGLFNVRSLDEQPTPEFQRLGRALQQLTQNRIMDIGQAEEGLFVLLHDYAAKQETQELVEELLGLLGLNRYEPDGSELMIPVRQAVARSQGGAIHAETRSVMDIIQLVEIDLPPEHVEAGIVEAQSVHPDQERPFLRIRSSEDPPEDATVAIPFRDHWYYVDARDTQSKEGFMALRTVIGMRLRSLASEQSTPVITIPVN
jgi:hypothetical protein